MPQLTRRLAIHTNQLLGLQSVEYFLLARSWPRPTNRPCHCSKILEVILARFDCGAGFTHIMRALRFLTICLMTFFAFWCMISYSLHLNFPFVQRWEGLHLTPLAHIPALKFKRLSNCWNWSQSRHGTSVSDFSFICQGRALFLRHDL